MLLATQAARIHDPECQAGQSWFRRSNQYEAHLLGAVGAPVGPQHSSVAEVHYLAVPVGVRPETAGGVTVTPWTRRQSGLFELAVRTRGRVYAVAEELDHEDLLLDAVDQLYSTVGLRRYRRVWLAMLDGYYGPVGAAVAYRGPLGSNFSFLENRCELLVEPTLTGEQAGAVMNAGRGRDGGLRGLPAADDAAGSRRAHRPCRAPHGRRADPPLRARDVAPARVRNLVPAPGTAVPASGRLMGRLADG